MVVDRVLVDLARAGDRCSECAFPHRRAVIGIEREDLVRHRRQQDQIAGATAWQRDAGHYQGLRFGTAAISRQRSREQSLDAASADHRGRQHALLGVRATTVIAVGAGENGDAHRGENSCGAVYVTLSSKGAPAAGGRPAPAVLKVCQPSRRTVACSAADPLDVTLAEASEAPAGSSNSTARETRCGQGESKLRNSAMMRVPAAVQIRPTVASPSRAGATSKSPAPKTTCVVLRGRSTGAAPKPVREKQR